MEDERPHQIPKCHSCSPLLNERHNPTELSPQHSSDNVEKLEHQLQTCLDEISLVKLHLQRLEQRKTSLEAQLNECQSLLSPFHKLPTEIWTEIFTLCVPGNGLSVSETGWNRVEAIPYVLSHVCSRWREIINFFPGLWSSVRVNLYALNRDITLLLKSYFSRSSKGRGLEVFVQFRKSSGVNGRGDWVDWRDQGRYIECLREGPWTTYAGAAFECILANSEKMKGLDVSDVGERNLVGNLRFPLVESLTFKDHTVPSRESLPSWLNDALHTAPNLRYLNLDVRGNTDAANRKFRNFPKRLYGSSGHPPHPFKPRNFDRRR
ncbi:hypothetical protein L218DRAFT_444691 [Marasmius fiardii PR-910]|nr:hypothetical protein L218DRAFT_444691 [Marasmius fiardii PR-910]